MASESILFVEDDARVADAVIKGLAESGYDVRHATSGRGARTQLDQRCPDLMILDLGLPDIDGLDLLAECRAGGMSIPVLILTARDQLDDKVRGLESGGDDYLVKPFAFAELLARIRSLLRRSSGVSAETRVGDLRIDLVKRDVVRDGQEIVLTQREFDLLAYLVRNRNENVTRDMLARDVWKITSRATPIDNVIDVHMSHLREKVDKPFSVRLIKTIRGIGYRLEEPSS